MSKQIITIFTFTLFTFLISAQENNSNMTLQDVLTDNNIEIPEDIERNLDELLIQWHCKYIKDPDCDYAQENYLTHTDSIYINRLYSLPTEMELVYNQVVRSYIDMYTTRRKTSVEYMLAKGEYYFPFIEEILDRYGLPQELKYLPVIESALNPTAVSRAGATGLWQFMLRTGKMYDLEVNSLVDERRDPVKATESAARYLKDLYEMYNDWNLAIAAYNCGPGNVNKAIRRSGGLNDYWAIYSYLPKETRGYVPAFIAATYIMNYYPEHNICPAKYIYPVAVDTIIIDQQLHFKQISETLNIPIEELRDLNPQYKKDIIPGSYKGYSLCLPSKAIAEFIINKENIYNYKSQELLAHRKTVEVQEAYSTTGKATKTHKIKSGETLGSIGKRYGVTVAHLKKMNNLKSTRITAGKTLVINRETIKKDPVPQPQPTNLLAENKEEVRSDTITNDFFANYYNKKEEIIIPDTLQLSNDEEIDNLITERNPFDDSRNIYHKVKIGETITLIAKKYNVSDTEILAWNNLSNKKIKIGQRLMIKLPESMEELSENAIEELEKDLSDISINNRKPTIYKVKKGDSLYVIAKKFNNITPEDIILANNLKNNKLRIGQQLNIPVN